MDSEVKRGAETYIPSDIGQLRFVFDCLRDGVLWLNHHGEVVYANLAACHTLELGCDEMLASRIFDLTLGLTEERWLKHWEQLKSQQTMVFEMRCRTKSGGVIPIEVTASHYRGDEEFSCVVAHDISRRKEMEETMQLAVSIYMSSSEAVLVTDENSRIIQANPAFTQITGYTLEELKGNNPNMLNSGLHDEEHYRSLWGALQRQGHWQGELWDRRKNGELFASWVSITKILHHDGDSFRYVAQFTDVTEKKAREELNWHYANYDNLTGLPNRRLFFDRLEQEIKKAGREGLLLGLMFIDLDGFKQVNDTLGHDKGDMLLVEVARRISACVRETDTVARLGGDEFTIILPNVCSCPDIERIAMTLCDRLKEPFELEGVAGSISASVGIACYPRDAKAASDLLRQADKAMYRAKAEGRSGYACTSGPLG